MNSLYERRGLSLTAGRNQFCTYPTNILLGYFVGYEDIELDKFSYRVDSLGRGVK